MCRLFGFRSVIQSQVHRSLVGADNALAVQSAKHRDGWGVAYYVGGAPHVVKSANGAMDSAVFRRVSGVVSSETVLAHIRQATRGELSVLNSHPFQYGQWVMAHNGDVPEFEQVRERLEAAIAPGLRRFILGDTDSERIFFMFLTELARYGPLDRALGIECVLPALKGTITAVREICDGREGLKPSLLTMIVTNGTVLAAIHGGKELFYSTYKTRCADRATCPNLTPQCEHPTRTGFVNHLIVSSEPLSGENIWLELRQGDVIGVDWRMRLVDGSLGNPQAAMAAGAG
ncbi:MAG: class II glutamine amidotransferase [Proteobacteria bacterium]|nr:MAG: class II glutamine amidotransferase [Pseudomonadota bacterium]